MAKVIEEIVVVKLSRMVKDTDKSATVVTKEQRKMIEDTIPTVVEELVGNNAVIVEVAELD